MTWATLGLFFADPLPGLQSDAFAGERQGVERILAFAYGIFNFGHAVARGFLHVVAKAQRTSANVHVCVFSVALR